MSLRAAPLVLMVMVGAGCTLLPSAVNRTPAAPTLTPHESLTADESEALQSPRPGACTIEHIPDDAGTGATFSGRGFAPDAPLEMTLGGETLTEEIFEQLHSDVRGAFELRLGANRRDIGDFTVSVTDGACIAEEVSTVSASRFPEAECESDPETGELGGPEAAEYAALVATAEPVAYWRFEENPGSVPHDRTGDVGELVEPAHLGERGFIPGSRSLLLVEVFGEEGQEQGGWLDVPDVELDADFTIETWLKFCGELVWAQDGLVGVPETGPDINFFEWRARLFNGDSDAIVSKEQIKLMGWHHLTMTRSGSELAFYEDGEKTGSGAFEDVFPVTAIGRGVAGTFGGWLDEFAIYDHALSADEIAAHAAFGEESD